MKKYPEVESATIEWKETLPQNYNPVPVPLPVPVPASFPTSFDLN